MSDVIDEVLCPITGSIIDIGLCCDIQDVIDDMIKEDILKNDLDFTLTSLHKGICKNCKKRIDPSL